MFEKESVSARTAGCPAGRRASPVGSERLRCGGAAVAGGAAVPYLRPSGPTEPSQSLSGPGQVSPASPEGTFPRHRRGRCAERAPARTPRTGPRRQEETADLPSRTGRCSQCKDSGGLSGWRRRPLTYCLKRRDSAIRFHRVV